MLLRTHEQILTPVRPYQTSPFGNSYLPTNWPPYNAGSRSYAEAGLAHYTTRLDQVKEMDETSDVVNIGLHYVATTGPNSTQPKDTDGDGIPDYVEDMDGDNYANDVLEGRETSPSLAQTVPGAADALNPIYDDIDLDGDGMVGRIEKALSRNPIVSDNPLTLTQVPTGDEPQFVMFEIPIAYDTVTNAGILELCTDGIETTLYECFRASNGNCLLSWNTAYDPFGQHHLQARFRLAGAEYGATVLTAVGSLTPYYSGNVLRFFEGDSLFRDTGAYLDAKLASPNATYIIELYDPSTVPPTRLWAITNSTANGMIQEDWDLVCEGEANVFAGSAFDAVFNVTLLDSATGAPAASGKATKRMTKIVATEQGNGFNVVYMYTPTNRALEREFSSGVVWWGMQGVVDILMHPNMAWFDRYESYFNEFSAPFGYPGYVTSRETITNYLYPTMATDLTKNFYCYAHGTSNAMANATGDVYMWASEVANLLGNHHVTPDPQKPGQGGLRVTYPYRFVFLDGCSTASANIWRRAFGIMPIWAPEQSARFQLGPQAFVGWATEKTGWMSGWYSINGVLDFEKSKSTADAYTATLQWFFYDWMSGATLAQCIRNASNTNLAPCPLPVPEVKTFAIEPPFTSISFTVTNQYPSKIYVVGRSGLTRYGHRAEHDRNYEPPNRNY